ncbi:uncharacterized protein LOC143034103 [Oratosquilla oratoria]|uniref:uncharacterized protein LOC143034103 n=1 Tax=Oratosquilla oratoria TaxID=337810 RepID=UPI003F7635B0
MPKTVMKEMLLVCANEAPFKCPQGKLFVQIDGAAMGSPLGVLYAQAFMSYAENEALHSVIMKPHLYLRYIDNIFVCVSDMHMLEELRSNLQAIFGLQLSTELNVNNKILLNDALVDTTSDNFETMVYRKPIDSGKCMKGLGECSLNYKKGAIRAYVWRAISICSSWRILHLELTYLHQMLVNKGYPNQDFDCN